MHLITRYHVFCVTALAVVALSTGRVGAQDDISSPAVTADTPAVPPEETPSPEPDTVAAPLTPSEAPADPAAEPDTASEEPQPGDETVADDAETMTPALSQDSASAPEVAVTNIPSTEIVRLAWAASSKSDLAELDRLVEQIMLLYGETALQQQASLSDFPPRGKEGEYSELNDVATVLFIRAEAYMNAGKVDEAISFFEDIITRYSWAQAWDPRGWYWSVAEKSQSSINVMLGKVEEEEVAGLKKGLSTKPVLARPGTENVVDYLKYGEFQNVGTTDYHYVINDPAGLAAAVGEGIYPNTGSWMRKNPGYEKAETEGRLKGNHWDFVHTEDFEAAYYKWVEAAEPWGVKLFYLANIFERAGMYYEAIKAYQALIIHFPITVAWTYWQTPWYPAQAAVAKIKHLINLHPELGLTVRHMKIIVENGFDNDVSNDRTQTWPGKVEKLTAWDKLKARFTPDQRFVNLGEAVKTVGRGRVQLVQFANGHWQLLVNGKPYLIRGITYTPTKIGQSPDKGTLKPWMEEDTNGNGLPDGPYDSWVDKNNNNQQDPDEPVVGDFQLMKEMGVNTIREYHQPFTPHKDVLRRMYDEHGIMVVMGDFLGKYTLGSDAVWFEGTDYENPQHQSNMMASVRKMVEAYKDEPYILMWLLGNENNYGVASNADKKPDAYFKFANEVAKMIKSIDPDHPVAVCNGDTLFLDKFGELAPDIDIFAANVYRGDYGFGSFWEQVQQASGKPAFITEYGSPAYGYHMTIEEADKAQANYHRGNWMDIEANAAGRANGVGNSIGGFVFEWLDEWWKNYEPFYHDRKSDAVGPFPGGYYFEEWFGIIGQGNGQNSPFQRNLRESYFAYQEMWSKPAFSSPAGGCKLNLKNTP